MASPARLGRLRNLVLSDVNTLPDRSPTPEQELVSDDDDSSGIPIEPNGHPPPLGAQSVSPEPALQGKQILSASAGKSDTANGDPPSSAPPVSRESTDNGFVWHQGATSSFNLGRSMPSAPLPTQTLPPTNLQRGDLVSAQESFVPIYAIAKYPYKFCKKEYQQDIASLFFDAGKFWARGWDLFYVWDISATKPLVLVRETQVQHLLNDINRRLQLELRITEKQREDGLATSFPDHPRTLPRYLGQSNSRDEVEDMASQALSVDFRASGERQPPSLDEGTLEDFKAMMEDMWELQKGKSKAAKRKRLEDRVAKQKVFADQLKRAQRHLGLRPTAQNGGAKRGPPPAIDPSAPAPSAFDRDVVFICVDVESYERDHKKITEIGIATLDTRDLVNVPPGEDGKEWRSKIRARHFRISDYKHLVNSEFVSGCPDRFIYGTSEMVRLSDAKHFVASCFKPPFCARAHSLDDQQAFVEYLESIDTAEKRELIFLGHDTLTDVKYLHAIDFDPLPHVLEQMDTAAMYRVWRRENNNTSLGRILYDFDIAGFSLHNAGNDAVYTIQAMLAVCVREASIRGTAAMEKFHEADKALKLAVADTNAKEKVDDDITGWSDDGGDGGDPVPTVLQTSESRSAPASTASPASENGGNRARGNGSARGSAYPVRGNGGNRSQTRGRGGQRARGQGRGSPKTNVSDPGEPKVHFYW